VTDRSWAHRLLLAIGLFCGSLSAQTPASPVFYETENSDEWVKHTLHVQSKYPRVLVVDAADRGPPQIQVASLDLNSRVKDDGDQLRSYRLNAANKTLQEAADASQGGDLIAVLPGH
jgi:hypothetical protein